MKTENSLIHELRNCKLRDYTTHIRDLIRWAGLARFVGPASSAKVTFIPVLHEKGLPGAAIFI